MTPDGVIAFWAWSVWMTSCWLMPRAAISRVENSRKITSSWAPIRLTLPTFGTVRTLARTSST